MPLSLDGTGSIVGIVTVSVSDDLTHVGDTNTKISFPANDTISFETNGAERLRIRSDGKVGIGTDLVGAPASNYGFGFYRATGTGYLYTETGQSGASAGLRAKAGTSDFTIFTTQGVGQLAVYDNTNSAERLRINSDGKVGLGTTGSDYALSIREADNNNKWFMLQKNSGQQLLQIREDGDNHVIIDGSHASGELHFYTAGSERLRMKSGGQVNIGNSLTQTSRLFTVESTLANGGEIAYIGNNDGGSNYGGLVISAGEIDRECRLESAWGNSFFTFHTQSDGAGAGERLRIAANGQVGINKTPDTNGGLIQFRYNEVFTSGTTNLLTSSSKAVLRLQTSSDSPKSLFFGGIDESATPYLQVGNMSNASGGATAVYPMVLQPYGGTVNIGGNFTQTNAPLSVTTDANDYGIRLLSGSNVVFDLLNNDGSGNCEIRGYHNNNTGSRGEGFRIESNGNTFFSPAGSNRTFSISNAEFQVNNQEVQITSSNSYACHFNYQDNGSHYISMANSGATTFRRSQSGGTVLTVYGSGNIGAPSGNNIHNASDERLKENMVELTDGLDKIKKLKPYSFTWKKGFDKDLEGIIQYGFGAHQAKSVDEKLVEKFALCDIDVDGETIKDPLRVNEKHVIPLLVKAIQELSAKVAALEGS